MADTEFGSPAPQDVEASETAAAISAGIPLEDEETDEMEAAYEATQREVEQATQENSLRLLSSEPDRIGEHPVHRQPPTLSISGFRHSTQGAIYHQVGLRQSYLCARLPL